MSQKSTAETTATTNTISIVWAWMGVAAHVIICLMFSDTRGIAPPVNFAGALVRAVGFSIPVIGLSILVLAPIVGMANKALTYRHQPLYCRFNVTIAVWVGLIFERWTSTL
ncbi:MAG: hypothetical protein ABSC04_05775 [Syntrophobacteraceae bacterium]